MSASYDATPTPSSDGWPDDLRRGAELLAGAVDPEQLAAFDLVWQARDAADQAALSYIHAIGVACRALGVDLGGLVDLLARAGDASRILGDILALRALVETPRSEP